MEMSFLPNLSFGNAIRQTALKLAVHVFLHLYGIFCCRTYEFCSPTIHSALALACNVFVSIRRHIFSEFHYSMLLYSDSSCNDNEHHSVRPGFSGSIKVSCCEPRWFEVLILEHAKVHLMVVRVVFLIILALVL